MDILSGAPKRAATRMQANVGEVEPNYRIGENGAMHGKLAASVAEKGREKE